VDFRREVEALLCQIPMRQVARCGDVARALGDVRASVAVYRFVREHPRSAGANRVVAGSGPSTADLTHFEDFRSTAPLASLRREQLELAQRVSQRNGFRGLKTVGGVDVSYDGEIGFAAAVVLRAADLAVIDEAYVSRRVEFPYIPTYLSHRELPLVRAAIGRLRAVPTVLLVDGHGRLHPAKFGIACHVGVTVGIPTIGVAKNPLVGTVDRSSVDRGASPIRVDGRILGYALRPPTSGRPAYVSVGHQVSLRTAVRIVRMTLRSRQAEPLRLADELASKSKRKTRKRFEES
jgi:deoxyribonuclease V